MIRIISSHLFEQNPYKHINDLDELDQLVEKIEYSDSDTSDNEYYDYKANETCILIYSRMLELKPAKQERQRIEHNLLRLLLQQGWGYKKHEKYDAATVYFQHLISKNPNIPIPRAHYRLGFIYLAKEDLLNALHHFSKAISDHNQLNSFHESNTEASKLTQKQYIKATIQLSIVSRKISGHWSIKAKKLINDFDDPDNEIFDSEVHLDEVIQLMKQPYIMFTEDQRKPLTRSERRQLAEKDRLYMDFVSENSTLYFNDRHMNVTHLEKVLIRFFAENKGYYQQKVLREYKEFFETSEEVIRQRINRIGNKCVSNLGLPNKIIDHRRGMGYFFNFSKYSLILSSNDPGLHLFD